jgi:hypothetical protein
MVLASIRKISGKKKLKKLSVKHADPVPYQQIKNIGILYYLESETELKGLIKILKSPLLEGKRVETICWLKTTKKKPHPVVEGISFVERADFDTNFLPSTKKSRYFCDQEFDLLLDLTHEYHFPIHAMSVMSNARLKTGMAGKLNWHLQVKIKPGETKNKNAHYLFEQIFMYLEKLF